MPIRETEDFVKAVNQEVVKVLMLENPEYLRNVYEKLSHELGDKLSLTISKPYFLEIMDKGIEKSAALLHICNKLGIKTEQLIAFGDSYNDLSMLTAAGLGIAMGNAREDVKKQSDYVTDGNNEDGIFLTLQQSLLSFFRNLQVTCQQCIIQIHCYCFVFNHNQTLLIS